MRSSWQMQVLQRYNKQRESIISCGLRHFIMFVSVEPGNGECPEQYVTSVDPMKQRLEDFCREQEEWHSYLVHSMISTTMQV
jgi:hypothetical protein